MEYPNVHIILLQVVDHCSFYTNEYLFTADEHYKQIPTHFMFYYCNIQELRMKKV